MLVVLNLPQTSGLAYMQSSRSICKKDLQKKITIDFLECQVTKKQ